jgi:hypothetical protein
MNAFVQALLHVLVVSGLLSLQVQAEPKAIGSLGCQREVIVTGVSPDDRWIAVVQEEVCSGLGMASTGISDVVQIVARDQKPENSDDVFAVDEHGDPTLRPNIRWLSSTTLQITVPNKSLIGLDKKNYVGIDIVTKFEPDDPAERELFLKQRGLSPK